jgi:hypothetical protein
MRPDYKPELHVGNKNTRIIKKEIFVFAQGKELIDVKTVKKKKFTKVFGEYSQAMKKFIDEKSLKFSVENDLKLMTEFYNSLVIAK